MYMRFILMIVLACSFHLSMNAQHNLFKYTKPYKNAHNNLFKYTKPYNTIYIEAAGSGVHGSLNYERFFSEEVSLRIGLGFYVSDAELYPSVPVSLQYLKGYRNNNFFEIGVGYTWAQEDGYDSLSPVTSNFNLASILIGYRKYFWTDWMVKVNILPSLMANMEFYPWLGASIGKKF